MKILLKNKEYAYVKYQHPNSDYGIRTKFVYANGEDLKNGDKAEMFTSVVVDDFFPFMESALAGKDFSRQHYMTTLGYYPKDFDSEEIKEDEICLGFLDDEIIIHKKCFYELCLFACDARLIAFPHTEIEKERILDFKTQLQEKINLCTV